MVISGMLSFSVKAFIGPPGQTIVLIHTGQTYTIHFCPFEMLEGLRRLRTSEDVSVQILPCSGPGARR